MVNGYWIKENIRGSQMIKLKAFEKEKKKIIQEKKLLREDFKNNKIDKEFYESKLKELRKEEYQLYKQTRKDYFFFEDYDPEEESELIKLTIKSKMDSLNKSERLRFKVLSFRHHAQGRMTITIESIIRLGKLLNKSHYNYKDELIEQMNSRLNREIEKNLQSLKVISRTDITNAKIDYLVKYERECRVCGKKENLLFTHKKPLLEGGKNNADNLILLCEKHRSEYKSTN